MSATKKVDPYKVLHWVLVGTCGASFAGLVVLIAFWHESWSGLAEVIAAGLGVGGSVAGLRWVEQQRLNTTLPDQWAKALGSEDAMETETAPAQQSVQATTGDEDADWEAGE